ncbi:MAG: putative lipid II flippase FtsW [bacterium]
MSTKPAYSHRIDSWTALTVFGLVMFGIVMIYSASVIVAYNLFGDDKYFFKHQIVWAIVGLIGMATTANIDYHVWKKWAGAMLVITLILLISVFLFSKGEINGAHRWIVVAGQTFQPSELAKLTFIIYLSAWLVERQKVINSIKETFIPYVVVLVAISVLMLKQPDFGTLAIILTSAIAVYVVAGLTWKQASIGLVALVVAVAVISISSPYRRDRLLTFLNPAQGANSTSQSGETTSKSNTYQVDNASIAIGSGSWTGVGFGQSKQKRRYLPEPQTDSIFAIIGEELGFLWSAALILAYVFLIYRGYLIASLSTDLFGRLVAVGITSWFAFQAFVNVGSMVHLVPLVGVPLPFISYGGTNLLISLLAVGVLLNISRFIKPREDADTKPSRVSRQTRS